MAIDDIDIRNKYSRVRKLSIEGHRIENLKLQPIFKHTLEHLNASRNVELSVRRRDGEEKILVTCVAYINSRF